MNNEPDVRIPVVANDFIGREIKIGRTICYPVRRGSRMWLKKLVVTGVQDSAKGPCVSGTNETGRRITIHKLSNCVVVLEPN
ncbi:MAG: hypothetical protein ACYS7Y_11655 [Planctomycetota bacterium]|jgi:hypothetical protein